MSFAEVAVDASAGHDRTFSYSIPPELDVVAGQLVMVPFGPRTLQGIVLSLAPSPQVPETRDIISTSDGAPPLTDLQLGLARWLSHYYMCTLFEAGALMLPPGGRVRQKTYLAMGANPADAGGPELTEQQCRVLDYLDKKGRVQEDRLLRVVGPGARGAVRALVGGRVVVRSQHRASAPVRPKRVDYIKLAPRARQVPAGQVPAGQVPALGRRAPRQESLVRRLLTATGPMGVAEARREYGRSVVAGLLSKGWIEKKTDSSAVMAGTVGPNEYLALVPSARDMSPERLPPLGDHAYPQEALLERLMAKESSLTLAQANREYGSSAVRALLNKGWLERETVTVERDPLSGSEFLPDAPVSLSKAQQAAASAVRAALSDTSASPRAFLLEGVTGSGKTEVYLDAVNQCLRQGRRAIVMVPEISLTPQTIERFASRFPGQVAVLHSGLSPGERFDQWWKIQQGEYGVVVGSRSAVFAPQPDLGLIVIDEEHEWTYKQHDTGPRYHTRDVALRLARLSGAVVLMGSASPDVVVYHRALSGRFGLLRLPERIADGGGATAGPAGGRGLARVQLVDMREELRQGNRLMFSRALMEGLAECLADGSQALLFLNRRGSASYVQCRRCGHGLRCGRCDVTLTYHRAVGRLLCHHCGHRRVPPKQCPQCRAFKLGFYGSGTQAVVDEVLRRFPDTRVLRWDRDSTKTPAAYAELLEGFRNREAQVLVGTQMIAKGLHLPSVTLVGVVSADVGLHIPDYRAGERAFQLLCQVAGRAGRGDAPGKVIIQTFQPDNYAIQAAAAQDFRRFYRLETEHRREQGCPPFGKLIRLLYVHTNAAACEREALRVSEHLRRERDSSGHSDIDLLGPMPAYPARLRGRYRWQVILRGAVPRALLDRVTMPQEWVVDVDPVGLG